MWSCHMFQQNCMDDTPPLAWGGSLNSGLYTILRTTPNTLFPTLHLHDVSILRRASGCSLVVSICLVDPLVCQIGFLIRPARIRRMPRQAMWHPPSCCFWAARISIHRNFTLDGWKNIQKYSYQMMVKHGDLP